ncbi:MAG TPA: hypothetical protein ENI61_06720 [Ignavibacteria bacterium]|nr:hypothetical protein [Ignavibacteria bacterium]
MKDKSGIIKRINFDDEKTGKYTAFQVNKKWNNPGKYRGVNEGRCMIISGKETYNKKSLRIKYPKGKINPKEGGAQWRLFFDKPYKELYVQYKVMFPKGFNFVRGGKLPGFGGGSIPVGGQKTDDGFSARIMWRVDGFKDGDKIKNPFKAYLTQYIYYPAKKISKDWGEDFNWIYKNSKKRNKKVYPKSERWHTIKMRIKLGIAGKKDDLIESWFDGKKVLRVKLALRDKKYKIGVDTFIFTTSFGGNDKTWFPVKDEYIYFDDFIISTKDIPFETKK